MKKTLLILSTILVAFSGLSQEPIRTRKVVQVMPQQEMYLNGGIRSAFGGKSRVYYQITLPPNTVEWYYVVTTHPAEQHPSLNLLPQLTKLLDPTGTTAILASAIMTPTGSNTCDVYLMDRANADAFIQKADNNGGKYFHVVSANRENFRNGTVQINNIKQGTWYLGFKNPSESQGIGISFEVAAIVEEVGYAVEQTKAINYGNLGWKAYEDGDIDRCIELSKKALSLDNTLGWVKANLGLCYLIKGDDVTATDFYIDALADIKNMKSRSTAMHYLKATVEDIDSAIKKYGPLKNSTHFREMFESELRRFNNG